VTPDGLKLTVYFGDGDRRGRHLVSDLLLDLYEREAVKAAVLLRGAEGFGIRHQLHTQRLLTLSEDMPLVSTAVDGARAIERIVPEVEALVEGGLVTLERASLVTTLGESDAGALPGADVKLTLFLGRRERAEGRLAHTFAVDLLRRHGVAGATVLMGVDGLVHHERKRATLLARNADVPLVVVSVGSAASIAAALGELAGRLRDPLATLERATVLRRDGVGSSEPAPLPETGADGLGLWQKISVFTGEQVRHGRRPLYLELVHRLRLAGASGATAIRGIWGYSGDRAPHGDTLLAVRRRVPVVVTLVDRPATIRSLWPVVAELTQEHGLVTSETVPAFRAVGPGIASGGLRLAARHDP
jgi:PII-like signaling protein